MKALVRTCGWAAENDMQGLRDTLERRWLTLPANLLRRNTDMTT